MDRKVLLGGLYSVLAVLAIGGTSCSGPTQVSGHTQRDFASVSVPMFAADGSKYIINGERLWHYSTQNTLLSDTLLLLPPSFDEAGSSTSLHGQLTAEGNLLLSNGRALACVTPAGALVWALEPPLITLASLAPDGGAVCRLIVDEQYDVARYGEDGSELWRRRFTQAIIDFLGPDVVVLDGNQLTRLDPAGNVRWSISVDYLEYGGYLRCTDGLIVLYETRRVHALDPEGNLLWSQEAPAGGEHSSFDIYQGPVAASAERVIVKLEQAPPWRETMLVFDGQGNQLASSASMGSLMMFPADREHFLTIQVDDKWSLGWHSADDSAALWQFLLPGHYAESDEDENGFISATYSYARQPVLAENGMIYFDWHSRLYEFDQQGNLVHEFAGTCFKERWVPHDVQFGAPAGG